MASKSPQLKSAFQNAVVPRATKGVETTKGSGKEAGNLGGSK